MLKEKIKILIQLNQVGYGGTEKAIYTFLNNLDNKCFIPFVFLNSDIYSFNYYRIKFLSYFFKKYEHKFIEKYHTSFARLNEFSKLLEDKMVVGNGFKAFIKFVNEINPNIIHFNRGTFEDFYTKRINEIPNNIKLVETNIFGKDSDLIYLKKLDSIFFVSKWLKDKSEWSLKYDSKVLYNPINNLLINQTLREQFNIPTNDIVLGRISRPNLDNGDFILEVLKKIAGDHVWFISLGASDNFIELTKNNSKIINLKPTTDLVILDKFYNTLDILLHFRKEGETFGMNIAEAMIHSKPVVSHFSEEDNAQYELILSSKECGFITNMNVEEYTEKVKILIENSKLRALFSKNAESVALELFSERKVTKVLEDYYRSLFFK